ncbi:MAG: MFS transporter [Blastocatellia bacterium]|nr:MFS transporter [Blastocatellia bacterium]
MLLRQRNYALLWSGRLVSMLGDWAIDIGLPFYIYDISGSALATSIAFVAPGLPGVLFASLAGVVTDRCYKYRKELMVLSDVLRAVCLLLLLIVSSTKWLWLLFLAVFLEATVSQLYITSLKSLIPEIVDKEDLVEANSLDIINESITSLIGPLLGGFLMLKAGLNTVVIFDVSTYLISAVMLSFIKLSPQQEIPQNKLSFNLSAVKVIFDEWLDGLKLMNKDRITSAIFVNTATGMIAEGIIYLILVIFVKEVWQGSTLELGWLATSQAIGSVIGGLIFMRIGSSIPYNYYLSFPAIFGIFYIIIVQIPVFNFALFLTGLAGMLLIGTIITVHTLLQQVVADKFRGRIFGAFNTTCSVFRIVGFLLGTLLDSLFGFKIALLIGAGFYILSGLSSVVMLGINKEKVGYLSQEAAKSSEEISS